MTPLGYGRLECKAEVFIKVNPNIQFYSDKGRENQKEGGCQTYTSYYSDPVLSTPQVCIETPPKK